MGKFGCFPGLCCKVGVGMPKPNVETFLDLVQRSGLVEKDRLQALVAQLEKESGGQLPANVDEVGRRFVAENLVTQWQCDRLLEGKWKGFFLGRYKLLGQLGAGGMSTVYLGEHVLMQRRVAIKVLPRQPCFRHFLPCPIPSRGPRRRLVGPSQHRAGLRRRQRRR